MPAAQARAASVKIIGNSLWRSAKLPKRATAACWRRSRTTFFEVSVMLDLGVGGQCRRQQLETARKGGEALSPATTPATIARLRRRSTSR